METNCYICGTVKNCGKYLDNVLKNMETIGALFSSYKIIISYDDSSDNSLEILKEYQQQNQETMILHVNTEQLYEYRVYNIAKGRNKCLNIIRDQISREESEYEYFIMMDCDDVCSDIRDLEPLEYYLLNDKDDNDDNDDDDDNKLTNIYSWDSNKGSNNKICWDSISFNKDPYYDLWALSKYPYSFSCMHFKDYLDWGKYIDKIIAKTPPRTLIPCLSAFNGFAIYKTNKFLNCYYDPRPRVDLLPPHLIKKNEEISGPIFLKGKAGLIDCEHRSFHLMAINKNNARNFIAPEIIFNTSK
jgi:hypothetical protein